MLAIVQQQSSLDRRPAISACAPLVGFASVG
jgi:hypothetical protein